MPRAWRPGRRPLSAVRGRSLDQPSAFRVDGVSSPLTLRRVEPAGNRRCERFCRDGAASRVPSPESRIPTEGPRPNAEGRSDAALSYNRDMFRVIGWRNAAAAASVVALMVLAPLALRPAAQAPAASGLDLASVSAARIIAHATLLADDLYEGRAPGSRGGDLAARYIATQFALLGLEPGAEDGTWYQPVPIVEATVDRDATTLQAKGSGGTRAFTMGKDLSLHRLGGCAVRVARCRGRVRGARHRRPRVRLERLCRRRREGEGRHGHGQRSAGHGHRAGAVRRQGAHVLRPLDLQVRGSAAAGRRRRHPHPHGRVGDLPVRRGAVDNGRRTGVRALGARRHRRCN